MAIVSFILMTCMFDQVVVLQGEIRHLDASYFWYYLKTGNK